MRKLYQSQKTFIALLTLQIESFQEFSAIISYIVWQSNLILFITHQIRRLNCFPMSQFNQSEYHFILTNN